LTGKFNSVLTIVMVIQASSKKSQPIVMTVEGIQQGVQRLFPVSIFVVPYGIAFGAASIEQGLSAAQTIVMSAIVFAGASQFAVLDLWETPLPYMSLAIVVLAVNARNIVLGAALSPWINALPWRKRLLSLFLLCDQNFADSHTAFKYGSSDVGVLLGGGLILWTTWVLGTCIGVIAGTSMGSLDRFGVDIVKGAFFSAIFVGKVKSRASFVPVLVAASVATVTYGLLPAGWNIITATLCGGIAGAIRYAK
jgi:4-azaleucine resistance transporter AzlC